MSTFEDPRAQDRRPTSVGRFRIVNFLGSGGMGVVYLAYDPHNDRHVALKLLSRFAGEREELRQRFNDEMRLPGGLLHPHVAAILEIGEWEGQPFVVMEYVSGQSLDQIIRPRPPLLLARRLHLLDQLCQGLHCAHAAGIIHRDIKPANLMVTQDWVLKLVDFGIARLAETGITHMTIAGTLGYMSPEQIEGTNVDYRSDIFSVGVVAYELFAFVRPFRGATRERVMLETLAAAPTPLDRVVDGLTSGMVSVVCRALSKHPRDRFEDLEAMRVALRSASAELSDAALSQPLRKRSAGADAATEDDARTVDYGRTDTYPTADPAATIDIAARATTVAHAREDFAPLTQPHRPRLRSSEEQALAPPPQVRLGFMKRIGQTLLTSGCGLATNALTAFLLVLLDTRAHIRVFTWIAFFVPVGALLSGAVAATGYYAGAVIARRRPTRFLLGNIVVTAIATWAIVWYLHYRLGLLYPQIPFLEFVNATLGQARGRDVLNGTLAGLLLLLQALGFALGGVIVFGLLRERPFCRRCQRYLTSPVMAKGFSAFEGEIETAHEQLRRFAASGNSMAAVALVRALPAHELTYQLAVMSWRCASCAREYFQTLWLEYRGDRWIQRQSHTFSQLTGADDRAHPSRPTGMELEHVEENVLSWSALSRARRTRQLGGVTAVTALAAALYTMPASWFGLAPDPDAFASEMRRIGALESAMSIRYEKWLGDKSADREPFGDVLKSQIIPGWERERTTLRSLRQMRNEALISKLTNYMDLKRDGWLSLADGLSANNTAGIMNWLVKEKEAAVLGESILRDLQQGGTKLPADARAALSARAAAIDNQIAAHDALQVKVGAYVAELRSTSDLEKRMMAAYDDALDRLKTSRVTPGEFADLVQRDVLPYWNDARRRLNAADVPDALSAMAKQMNEYMTLRADGWRLAAEGIRSNNIELVRQANKKQADAQTIARTMNTINALGPTADRRPAPLVQRPADGLRRAVPRRR